MPQNSEPSYDITWTEQDRLDLLKVMKAREELRQKIAQIPKKPVIMSQTQRKAVWNEDKNDI